MKKLIVLLFVSVFYCSSYCQTGIEKVNLIIKNVNESEKNINEEKYKDAIQNCNKILEIDSTNTRAYYNRAISRAELNDIDGALADYGTCIKYKPLYTDAYFNRGNLNTYLKDYYSATKDFDKVIELNPNDADAYYWRGYVRFEIGLVDTGCDDWKKALKLGSTHSEKMKGVCK